MPDGWEHDNGFSPFLADGNQDKDGDGYSNHQEFQRGSNANQYVLVLKSGWNNISISRMPGDNSVAAIFGNAVAGSVWYWADGRFQTANQVEPLTGYWMFAPGPGEIEIQLP